MDNKETKVVTNLSRPITYGTIIKDSTDFKNLLANNLDIIRSYFLDTGSCFKTG